MFWIRWLAASRSSGSTSGFSTSPSIVAIWHIAHDRTASKPACLFSFSPTQLSAFRTAGQPPPSSATVASLAHLPPVVLTGYGCARSICARDDPSTRRAAPLPRQPQVGFYPATYRRRLASKSWQRSAKPFQQGANMLALVRFHTVHASAGSAAPASEGRLDSL